MINGGLFTQTFMVHAWISGTIIAIICALVGFFVVIRGSSFVAHALPEIGFAGGAGAVLLHINPLYGLATFAVGGALLIGSLSNHEHDDVMTALIMATALGTGALFLSLSSRYASGAYALLFGQIVGISSVQVLAIAILGIICLLCFMVLYRPLLLTSVSQEIAKARGVPIHAVEMCFLVLVGLTAAVTVPIVGTLLCFSLLIGPNAASMYLTSNPRKAVALSVLFSLATVWISLILGYSTGWPIGFFVAMIGALLYGGARMIHALRAKKYA